MLDALQASGVAQDTAVLVSGDVSRTQRAVAPPCYCGLGPCYCGLVDLATWRYNFGIEGTLVMGTDLVPTFISIRRSS